MMKNINILLFAEYSIKQREYVGSDPALMRQLKYFQKKKKRTLTSSVIKNV